ncbi:class I SAM-dependent methyltransferase [Sinorhizobium chiapasense]|uniref:Class I SAM-dependent methyltransferase n=1 Tax=Sinorhizobium chiapasense TaxID=501572 RepID=A0ABZ2B3X2_9HYPH
MTPVARRTADIASDWKSNSYYAFAEQQAWTDVFWNPTSQFRRLFEQLDSSKIVDLACGHGRHTARLLDVRSGSDAPETVYLLDVNQENIDACRARFNHDPRIEMYCNGGYDFHPIPDESVTAVFCYDAMVHFEFDAVFSYIRDAARILRPGGRALFHHSNFASAPGADYKENPHWRNYMSRSLFAHAANRAGLSILDQVTINWDEETHLDCLSLVERPVDANLILVARQERKFDFYRRMRRKLKSLVKG